MITRIFCQARQWLPLCIASLCLSLPVSAKKTGVYNEPDSVYLFSYGINGLRFAWSQDTHNWLSIGKGHAYIVSDYGRWGAEKKMVTPYLIQGKNASWQLVWSLNSYTPQFAHASSNNLVTWRAQSYPYVYGGRNVLRPVISYDNKRDLYTVVYTDSVRKYYQTTTRDLRSYTTAKEVTAAQYKNASITVRIDTAAVSGQMHKVPWAVVRELISAYERRQYASRLNAETAREDAQRFAGLTTVDAAIHLQPQKAKPISTLLTGVFFEDINYAADGGLYAELVQNRGFEYRPSDKSYRDKNWTHTFAWSLRGEGTVFSIDSVLPVHANTSHYAVLTVTTPGSSLTNSGFDGMAVKKEDSYAFSAFIRQLSGNNTVLVKLVSAQGAVLAQQSIGDLSSAWERRKTVLTPSADAVDAHIELEPRQPGTLAFDMVSLFPEKTFRQRPNGLRADLAQAIADIHPRFVRFPGGCVAHGDGIGNIYRWKNTIGPLETRKPDRNLWNYHQSMGLGYFEYFQFCEDIGAEPVPVIAAGVPCQNSGTGGGGQQGGIAMSDMPQYIQDIIDLIEYANGDARSTWGRKRAEAGHPEPFHLKYIGIGNEDQITTVFEERFRMIYQALKKTHPEITVIGTAGPFFEGTDYEEGWRIASELKVPLIDEHYYQSPGWFIHNQDFYDRYDRTKSKIYLGEYAASLPGGNKTYWETSLAEALYLTAIERNGDVVSMASYAPLLGKEGHTQWNPDMIYFNNTTVTPTTGYYVQQLYGRHAGNQYIPATIQLSHTQEAISKRIAYSAVTDTKTGELIVKLVNMLPVAVNSRIDCNGMLGSEYLATRTVMSGKPSDKNVVPVTERLSLNGSAPLLELPAYSFTVLRLKTK
ncbi:alpha-L-arabinofuranosidase C-terminal domain-containing protein [Sediminibacterium soli]|uniref:alpha-L-arabinofuranosidase C-terminal domain-containing protein n=1 Tax=Sediminibacterium soli TaxID=2698829 RepID=UPI00137ABB5D|nr:alpha-L-arabinofuranosidase C-terminal domain-containing protein [Sediminibacterium soli]NCI45185.1 alpha-L-arabinofuranosidase [Sediminibacterium soli]